MFGIPDEHIQNVSKCSDIENEYASLTEEAGELISAVSKHAGMRYDDYAKSRSHIIEEMAHTLVSMNLVANVLSIEEDDILREIQSKAIKAGWDISQYHRGS